MQAIALALYLPFDGLVSLYVVSAVFGLAQGGLVPSYAVIIRELFPAQEAGLRVSLAIFDHACWHGTRRLAGGRDLRLDRLVQSRTGQWQRLARRQHGDRHLAVAADAPTHGALSRFATATDWLSDCTCALRVSAFGCTASIADIRPCLAGDNLSVADYVR